jgi:hypothetical protein
VRIVSGDHDNSVRGNRIFANGGLGIDVGPAGVTPNDNETDGVLNGPVLASASLIPAGLLVTGSITTGAGKTLRIEFFVSSPSDPEGARFLGFVTVVTNAGGTAAINVLLPSAGVLPGHFITATATDENLNTSEFSLAQLVT